MTYERQPIPFLIKLTNAGIGEDIKRGFAEVPPFREQHVRAFCSRDQFDCEVGEAPKRTTRWIVFCKQRGIAELSITRESPF